MRMTENWQAVIGGTSGLIIGVCLLLMAFWVRDRL